MQGGRRKSLAISRAKVLRNNVVYFKKKLRERLRPSDQESDRDSSR